MARWLLTQPHYLKVTDTFWEQTETDRVTGRQKKKKYPVPMHLDPRCAQDWNNKPGASSGHISRGGNSWDEGFITVCHEGKGESHDYVFTGDPTPDMEPIDEEAQAISATFQWHDPTRFFQPGEGEMTFAERMILTMQDEMKAQAPAQNGALNDTLAMLAQAVAQQTQLLAKLSDRR
jgi:hypothetical protein